MAGEAQRIIDVINKKIYDSTASGALERRTPGVIYETFGSGYEASAYVRVDDLITDVIVPNGVYVQAGDYVSIAQNDDGKAWIDRLIPATLYSRMALDYERRQILIGSGAYEPVPVVEFNDAGQMVDPDTGELILGGGNGGGPVELVSVKYSCATDIPVPGQNVWFQVPFDVKWWDTDDMYSSPGSFTIPSTGYYHIHYEQSWFSQTGGTGMGGNPGILFLDGVQWNSEEDGLNYLPAGSVITMMARATYDGTNPMLNDGAIIEITAATGKQIETVQMSQTPAGCVAYSLTSQTATHGVRRTMPLELEDYDSDGYHSNVSNNTRVTIPAGKGGRYNLRASVAFANNATGDRIVFLRKNGTDEFAEGWAAPTSSTYWTYVTVQADAYQLNDGDYIEIVVYQASGGNLTVGGTNQAGRTELSVLAMATYASVLDAPSRSIGAKVKSNGYQVLNNATHTGVTMALVKYDTDGFWTSALPSRFTVPGNCPAGIYRLTGSVRFEPHTAARDTDVIWQKNGAWQLGRTSRNDGANMTTWPNLTSTLDIWLTPGDHVEFFAYQNEGGACYIGESAGNEWDTNHMSISYIGSGSAMGTAVTGLEITRSTAQSISAGGTAAVLWDTVIYDQDGQFDPGKPGVPNINTTGWYSYEASGEFAAPTTVGRPMQLFLKSNGATNFGPIDSRAGVAGYATKLAISGKVYLFAGSYFEVNVQNNDTVSKDFTNARCRLVKMASGSDSTYQAPVIENTPGVSVSKTGQSYGSGAGANVSFSTEVRDTNNFWGSSTPTRLTVPVGHAGVYLLSVTIFGDLGGAVAGTTTLQAWWVKNGSRYDPEFTNMVPVGSRYVNVSDTREVTLAVGDYIEVWFLQNGGYTASMNILASMTRQATGPKGDKGDPGTPAFDFESPMRSIGAKVTTTGVQATVTGDQLVTFGKVVHDTDGFWTPALPTRMTVPANAPSGIYLVSAGIVWVNNGYGLVRALRFLKNGSSIRRTNVYLSGANTNGTDYQNTHTYIWLTPGDYVETYAYTQAGGGYVTLNPSSSDWDNGVLEIAYMGSGSAAGTAVEGTEVSRSTDLSVGAGQASGTVTFDTEVKDQGDWWQASPNPERITVKTTGWYTYTAVCQWETPTTVGSRMGMNVRRNGNIVAWESETSVSLWNTYLSMSGQLYLSAGDYITVMFSNGDTASKNVMAGTLKLSLVKMAAGSDSTYQAPVIEDAPSAKMVNTTTQTLSAGWNTAVFNTVEYDSHNFADTTNERFVIPAGHAGRYFIDGLAALSMVAASRIITGIEVNGVGVKGSRGDYTGAISEPFAVRSTAEVALAVGDVVTFRVYSAVGSQTISSTTDIGVMTSFSITRLATGPKGEKGDTGEPGLNAFDFESPMRSIGARVVRVGTQSISYNTITPIQFTATETDTDGFWTVALPSRLTVPANAPSGLYALTASTSWSTTAGAYLFKGWWSRNGLRIGGDDQQPGSAYDSTLGTVIAWGNPNDYFEFNVYTLDVSGRTIGGASGDSYLHPRASIAYLGSGSAMGTAVQGTEVSRSTAQTFTTGQTAAISFDTETLDQGSMWAVSPNPSRVTVNEKGWYSVSAGGSWAAGSTTNNRRVIYLRTGGAWSNEAVAEGDADASVVLNLSVNDQFYMDIGDYVELIGTNYDSVSRDFSGAWMRVVKLASGAGATLEATPIEDAPGARVRYNTTQSVNSSTLTAATFNIEDYDSHDFWTSTQPTRFTIPVGHAGRYRIYFSTHFTGDAATYAREVSIRVNGTTYVAVARDMNGKAGDGNVINCSADIVLAVGDYVEGVIQQNSGAPVACGWTGMPYMSQMSITRLATSLQGEKGDKGDAGSPYDFAGQLTFPATQNASSDANVLDDYEEGTWTPVMETFGGGAATYTTGHQIGKYQKVGKWVTASGSINCSRGSLSSVSQLRIAGLPFAVAAGVWHAMSIGYAASFTAMAGYIIGSYAEPGTSYCPMVAMKDGTLAALTATNINADGGTYCHIIFQVRYEAAS